VTDPRVLIIGGAGYIGSHTAKALHGAGFQPVVFDNLSTGHPWAVQWGPLEVGDIRDTGRLRQIIGDYQIGAVLHFAALSCVGESVAQPLAYYDNNVGGALSLLRAIEGGPCCRIVFSSTCATYGEPVTVPMPETHPQQPINPYGASKLMVERLLLDVGCAQGFNTILLRYFNAAGADPGGAIGEAHTPETHLIPLVLDAALGRRPEIKVFGDDYPTPDGTCLRDYIHVDDLADAHVRALRRLLAGGPTDAFNLGNGQGFSVREVIRTAEAVTGRPIPTSVAPRRDGDPPVLVADAAKARRDLGWVPARPALRDMVADALGWMTGNGAGR
jgi:UDP-arabinose 4-epimerase